MTREEVIKRLKEIPNGANIGITYRSDISKQLSAAERKAGTKIEKEGRVVLAKGMRKDRDPENIPGERTFGHHSKDAEHMTKDQSFVVEHNGNYYIDFELGSAGGTGISAPKYKYFINGKEVSKEELEPLMQPAAYKRMNAPHKSYSIKVDNIMEIRYKGKTVEELKEDLDDLTGGEYFDNELETGRVDIEEAYDEYNGDYDDPMEAGDSYGLDRPFDDYDPRIYGTTPYKRGVKQLERDRRRNESITRKIKSSRLLRENMEAQKYGYRNAAEMRAENTLKNSKKSRLKEDFIPMQSEDAPDLYWIMVTDLMDDSGYDPITIYFNLTNLPARPATWNDFEFNDSYALDRDGDDYFPAEFSLDINDYNIDAAIKDEFTELYNANIQPDEYNE